jgi:hypothetical protein
MTIKGFARDESAGQCEQERLQREAERAERGGVTPYTCLKGKTTLRVLPPFSEAGVWYVTYWEHVLRVAGRTWYLTCPRPHGRVCPLCDAGEQLFTTDDEVQLKRAGDLMPTERFLVNGIVLSDPGKTSAKDGLKLVKLPKMAMKEVLVLDNDVQGGWGDITNLESGHNITVERTGEGQRNTRYGVRGFPERTNILVSLKEQGVDIDALELHDLHAVLLPRDHEELVAVLEGTLMSGRFPQQQGQPAQVESPEPVAVPVDEQPTPQDHAAAAKVVLDKACASPKATEARGKPEAAPIQVSPEQIAEAQKILEMFTRQQAVAVPKPVTPPGVPAPPEED